VLFLIAVFAEIGVPLPFIPDSALFLTGYQNSVSIQSFYTFMIVFTGRHCGASLTYWISRFLGHKLLIWIGNHFPRVYKRISNLASGSNRRVPLMVGFLRLSGLLYVPSIAAGVVHIRFRYFILGVTISSLIFDGATTILGILTGRGFHILGFEPTNWSVIIGFILIMVIALLIQLIVSRRKRTE
jgi:membrane protein DedA with SNARE-associated domain